MGKGLTQIPQIRRFSADTSPIKLIQLIQLIQGKSLVDYADYAEAIRPEIQQIPSGWPLRNPRNLRDFIIITGLIAEEYRFDCGRAAARPYKWKTSVTETIRMASV